MVPFSSDSYIQADFTLGLAQSIRTRSNGRCGTVILQSTSSGSVNYPFEGTWYINYTGYSGTASYLVNALCTAEGKSYLYYALFYVTDTTASRSSQWYKYLELTNT